MLCKLPDDVFLAVCAHLGIAALARLDSVRRVRDTAWTDVVQQRCGPSWPAGKAGFYRFQHALIGCIPKPHGCSALGSLRARSAVALHAEAPAAPWCIMCATVLPGGQVVVGTDRGIVVFDGDQRLPMWSGKSVVDVASLGGTQLAFCTRQHRAYICDVAEVTLDPVPCGMYAFCVSGPVLAVGGNSGVWPFCIDREQSCLRIAQSATLVACWHLSGYMCTFGTVHGRALHAFHTGYATYTTLMLSVVGNVVRVNGVMYCDGLAAGTCTNDERSADACGTHVWARNKWRCGVMYYS